MRLIKQIKEWFYTMISKLGYLLAGSQAQRKPSYFRAIKFSNYGKFDLNLPIGWAPNVDFSDNPTTSPGTITQSSSNLISTQIILWPDGGIEVNPNRTVTTQGSITIDKTYDLYLHSVPCGASFPKDDFTPTLNISWNSDSTLATIAGFKVYFFAEKTNKFDDTVPWTFYCRVRNGITKKIYSNASRIPVTITKQSSLDTDSQYCYSINFDLTMTEKEVTSIYYQCSGRWNYETDSETFPIYPDVANPISTYIPIIVELI